MLSSVARKQTKNNPKSTKRTSNSNSNNTRKNKYKGVHRDESLSGENEKKGLTEMKARMEKPLCVMGKTLQGFLQNLGKRHKVNTMPGGLPWWVSG